MFKQISLKHFKAWCEPVEVKLAPITLLLGTNSSGKSSLLHSLLLLKQTIAHFDRTIHLNLSADQPADYFDFGDFNDVLNQTAKVRHFDIGFSFCPQNQAQQEIAFKARYKADIRRAAVIEHMQLRNERASYLTVREKAGAYSLSIGDDAQDSIGLSAHLAPERSIALSTEALELLPLHDRKIAQDISLAIQREFKNIAYLGPLRTQPKRRYVVDKNPLSELGTDGSQAIPALKKYNNLVDHVSAWLARLGVADRLEVKSRPPHYQVMIHKAGVAANLLDVGFGISQVLPVLTLAYFVPEGTTIILEEPEIHLHPLAQAVLAELLVEVSQQRHVQFLVETHSEHLFLRLQTLIARETLKADDCCLYFVENRDNVGHLHPLTLDDYGRLDDWPERFFGDALGEAREQTELFFDRQQKAELTQAA